MDYVPTLFPYTRPVDKAQKARTLADQGFDFANGARLQTPSFVRGKRKLSLNEVVMSKKRSEVRIRFERVIGILKTHTNYILQGTCTLLPLRMIKP